MNEIVKVVRAEEVEALSRQGWKLTEVLSASELVPHRVLIRPSGNNAQGMWENEAWRDDAHVVVTPRFVMRKDAEVESVEYALQLRISEQASQLVDMDTKVRELEKSFELQRKVSEDLAKQKVEAELGRDSHMKRANSVQERLMHNEKLLNLIRKEVGEAKWREFTGEHTSCVLCAARET